MTEEYYKICLRPLPGRFSYRGLQRLGPVPRDNEPLDSLFNCTCKLYINQGERIASSEVARDLFRRICQSTQEFELIRTQLYGSQVIKQECFLGFDICQVFWNSLLSWDWTGGPTWRAPESNVILMRAILDLFAPDLNSYHLFGSIDAAANFVKAVHALRDVCPGSWESPGHESYDIVAISEVKDTY